MNDKSIDFSSEELKRYSRHLAIPGFGWEAQVKLKAAKVLVIGAGGLGSPLLLYLAAAGVGTIGIIDFDVVDISNLQRQVLFASSEVGVPKVEAAKRRLAELNPLVNIIIHQIQLTSLNALDLIKDYDVVADGTDNFPTRYLVNDACVLLGKPTVYASIFQFEGQLSIFNYRDKQGERGPNFRDLYPVPPAPGMVQNCAEGGVLGVLPGIIGSLQALEVIKIITGAGEVMSGRFYIFDALSFESKTFKVKHNPDTHITQLIDYELFCGTKVIEVPIKEISAVELDRLQQGDEPFQLIDVREPYEYDLVNIGGELRPLSIVLDNAGNIAKDRKVILHCKTGGRSAQAIRELEAKFGFENLYNLRGGIIAYIDELNPGLPRY